MVNIYKFGIGDRGLFVGIVPRETDENNENRVAVTRQRLEPSISGIQLYSITSVPRLHALKTLFHFSRFTKMIFIRYMPFNRWEFHKLWANVDLKWAVMVYFKVPSRRSPGRADEDHKKNKGSIAINARFEHSGIRVKEFIAKSTTFLRNLDLLCNEECIYIYVI